MLRVALTIANVDPQTAVGIWFLVSRTPTLKWIIMLCICRKREDVDIYHIATILGLNEAHEDNEDLGSGVRRRIWHMHGVHVVATISGGLGWAGRVFEMDRFLISG